MISEGKKLPLPQLTTSERALATNWNSDSEKRLFTPQQAAQLLALSASWLAKLSLYGDGPAFLKLGRCVRYRREDLIRWAEAKLRRSTSDDGSQAERITRIMKERLGK